MPLFYEYAEVWVWFSSEGLPGPRERLLVRRSLGQEPELKCHRSNAPPEVPLTKVAQVRPTRWTIKEDIQSAKGECGLDEYETRGWIGWHQNTTLSLLALAFLGGPRNHCCCSVSVGLPSRLYFTRLTSVSYRVAVHRCSCIRFTMSYARVGTATNKK